MPILQCSSALLFEKLGQKYTEQEFTDLCFNFGIELDEVTNKREIYRREAKDNVNQEKLNELSDEEIYKIDIPANRYDLLCLEGLVSALLVFKGRKPPVYKINKPTLKMVVKPSILPVRPYVVCAVLRNINFTQSSYDSFIDLQEKLHQNICRKRTLVSVGTHDLDSVKGPFTYEGTPKGEIDFLPLAHAGRGNLKGEKITEYYQADKHIGRYVPLISNKDRFPAVYDSSKTLMSLPPIINSEHSKISMDTKNVFIECTAIDFPKANIVLNMIVSAFSTYVQDQFSIEGVEVEYPEDCDLKFLPSKTIVTPDFSSREFSAECEYINKSIGVDLTATQICDYLNRMLIEAKPAADDKSVVVQVPATRPDVLHQADIMEDVAIAYGYERLITEAKKPQTVSFGKQQPREALRTLLRNEMGYAGFTEMMTLSLCTADEATTMLQRADTHYSKDGLVRLVVKNEVTSEFQICRPSLLPGTLKTLSHSKDQPMPLQLFEVTDVVFRDSNDRIGARNELHLCAVRASANSTGFDNIQGLLVHIMQRLGIPEAKYSMVEGKGDNCFIPGWQVTIMYEDKPIGVMGVIDPMVLKNFEFPFPCSYIEMNVEPFFA
eukprot:TRINITY_DN1072_c0_g2_i1.p1 TRINITY_DN1072_c0_g2~~TRINITY_DN1072_c0_g2_i1.p1  ORF type:complete len:606 (+),score=94.76 TRINITY_DN1072_c0_g2_i1:44-1861(+)